MKKALLCVITATITFFTSLFITASISLLGYSDPPVNSKLSEIRPSLNPEFLALTERERDGLRGPVKAVRVTDSFYYRKGEHFEKPIYSRHDVVELDYQYLSYGQDGDKVADVQRPLWYTLHDPVQKVFNDRGLLIEEINYFNFDEGDRSVYSRNTYAYDDTGKIVESCAYNTEGRLRWRYVYQYVYDQYGNWIEQIAALDYIEEGFTIGKTAQGYSRQITYHQN